MHHIVQLKVLSVTWRSFFKLEVRKSKNWRIYSKRRQQKPLTDAPLLFPPGQLALASLRIANRVLGVVDCDRYLENIVSQPNSEHTTSELTKLLGDIESLVKSYKCPSEKDMKHINRKLKSCLGHSSSHDDSKKREKRSKHKSHKSSKDTPNGAPIG